MIYPLGGILLGALIGALTARQKGGTLADLLQWGGVFAIIFGIIGLFVLIFVERSYIAG